MVRADRRFASSNGVEDACQEIEDSVNGILLLLVLRSGLECILPQELVGSFEFLEFGGYRRLVTLYGLKTADYRLHVQQLTIWADGRNSVRAGGTCDRLSTTNIKHSIISNLWDLLFALDEAEEVGLSTVEVGVGKVPKLGLVVALQNTLLQMRNFVKSVHVELSYERSKVLVLEPAA